ncbi:MAG: ELM1/GtrOC1 family putative glycosyltransferase [Pseudomonadota bacterium]
MSAHHQLALARPWDRGCASAAAPAPFVWAVENRRCGDTEQTLALVEALPWPVSVIKVGDQKANARLLEGMRRAWSAVPALPLPGQPERPDLVICCGHEAELFAQEIRKAGSPDTRLVYIGRPLSPLSDFALIVSTPQYALPASDNVIEIALPFHRVRPERIAAAAKAWAPRFAHLPRPYIALMVGGSTGPYLLDSRTAVRLARQANERVRETGGSLLVSTCHRTRPWVISALTQHLEVPAHVYRWSADAAENPYLAYLGLADEIIVTGDSMSMLSEAAATAKPLHIFDLGESAYTMRQEWRAEPGLLCRPKVLARGLQFRLAEATMAPNRRRDIRRILHNLVASGHAVWLGDPLPAAPPPLPPSGIDAVARRVVALFEPTISADRHARICA